MPKHEPMISNEDFQELDYKILIAYLSNSSKKQSTINFQNVDLSKKPVEEIRQLFASFTKKSIHSLNLAKTNLAKRPINELIKLLKALPKNIKDVDLGDNDFSAMRLEDVVTLLSNIPEH